MNEVGLPKDKKRLWRSTESSTDHWNLTTIKQTIPRLKKPWEEPKNSFRDLVIMVKKNK
jgi:hypothetical protein